MNGAGFVGNKTHLWQGLWTEAVAVATKIENAVVTTNKPMPAYNNFYGREAPYVWHLHTFGEYGVVHDAKKIHSKLENCGETCIFVGYADDHAGNVYHMFNLQMRHVWTTRDVKWIQHPTGNEESVHPSITDKILLNIENVPVVETVPDKEDKVEVDHDAPPDANNTNNNVANDASLDKEEEIDPQILRQMKKLGGWFNPTAKQYIDWAKQTTEDNEVNVNHDDESDNNASEVGREVANAMLLHAPSKFAFYSAMKAIEKLRKDNAEMHHFVEPATFCEAYDHLDQVQHEKWHTAIQKEFHDMTKFGARSNAPQYQLASIALNANGYLR